VCNSLCKHLLRWELLATHKDGVRVLQIRLL
jgi:hypothetical protein